MLTPLNLKGLMEAVSEHRMTPAPGEAEAVSAFKDVREAAKRRRGAGGPSTKEFTPFQRIELKAQELRAAEDTAAHIVHLTEMDFTRLVPYLAESIYRATGSYLEPGWREDWPYLVHNLAVPNQTLTTAGSVSFLLTKHLFAQDAVVQIPGAGRGKRNRRQLNRTQANQLLNVVLACAVRLEAPLPGVLRAARDARKQAK